MFKFNEDYVLKNEIVELSPLPKEHEAQLFDASNDREIWTYFEEDGYGREKFNQYMDRAIKKREHREEYPFVIKDVRKGTYAGMTRIYAVSNSLKHAKIGHTWIGKSFQGTGLNKNGKFLLFKFLFDEIKMERIGFGASAENTKSIKAMESVGCRQEGRLRSFLPSVASPQRVDIVLLSILKNEWDTSVKAELAQKIACYT